MKKGTAMKNVQEVPLGSVPDDQLVFAVNVVRMEGQYLFCRHRERSTWECAGGHIEPGETPLQAARRELFEETGATEADITPVCIYRVGDGPYGLLCRAEVYRLGPIPADFEMAEVRLFDEPPGNWTYPQIVPWLLERTQD